MHYTIQALLKHLAAYGVETTLKDTHPDTVMLSVKRRNIITNNTQAANYYYMMAIPGKM